MIKIDTTAKKKPATPKSESKKLTSKTPPLSKIPKKLSGPVSGVIKKKTKFEPAGFAIKVKRSSAGLGLFAAEDMPKGICIIEYIGRIISLEEEYTSNSKYLFEVNKKTTLDGAIRTNTARYINHSCRPSAEPEIRKGRIYIMSRRKIKEGEEITYDYGKEYVDDHIKPHGCRCEKCKEKASK